MFSLKAIYPGMLLLLTIFSCNPPEEVTPPIINEEEESEEMDPMVNSIIDLNNWKITLPIGNPSEVEPPEILDYGNNELLKPYLFDDSEEEALVFFTKPGSTTANSSYSRTELREQMVAGSNNVNWTFAEGGKMSGRLRVSEVSGSTGDLDRIIVMQIHGRLTDEQRDLIGEDDNNAPPVLKIYWDDGKINVRRKVLKDLNVSDTEILHKNAWTDDSNWFTEEVGFEPFEIEISASDGVLSIIMNNDEKLEFNDVHVQKWGVFENYFKAGNYLQTSQADTYSEVKYFHLNVEH